MIIIEFLFNLISLTFILNFNILFLILALLFVFLYHIIIFFLRDRIYAKEVLKYKDPEIISLNDLKSISLVNIIVPAWKEGKIFEDCLNSIKNLTYPKLKVIVNAGGSENCINIAKSFQKYDNFIILLQKGGGSRAELGKLKALNECLEYVNEGILYFVDADVYFTDEVLLRMIFPITNLGEKVVSGGIKPLKYQENKDYVKYLHRIQNLNFRYKFSRYSERQIGGANCCIIYDAMNSIGKFSQNRIDAEDVSRGEDILKKGFRIYTLTDYRGMIYSNIADKKRIFFRQKLRWDENTIIYAYRNRKYYTIVKFFVLILISVYLFIFPFLLLMHIGLFFIGLLILFSLYLKKLRRILFFNKVIEKRFRKRLSFSFYLKIIYYIYIELIINIFLPFDLIKFLIKVRKM